MRAPIVAATARIRTVVSWSTGKDSAFALHVLRTSPEVEVVGLLSTVTRTYDRVAMHGVRRTVLEAQARAAGLPLRVVELPSPCSNTEYEAAMEVAIRDLHSEGVRAIAFGDLFLEDIRAYRIATLQGTGVDPLFPLWGRNTAALAGEMLESGLEARIACLDPKRIPRSLAGTPYDRTFLSKLPERTDPCGENGEFHTCVSAGPFFRSPLDLRPGAIVEREGFVFADLVLGPARSDRAAAPA
ncbi:MAG: adenine nucleotide alpha hydrolase [Thermoplasmata archaeon]|nr:adenine nucleotide alpha hydrolase [Thermoplasmata archaeon]